VTIIDALLANVKCAAQVHDVRVGAHWTAAAVRTDQGIRAGLASTLSGVGHSCAGQPSVGGAGFLLERGVCELAGLVRSDSIAEASIGLATINALLDVDDTKCVEVNAEEIIVEQGAGKNVAIVGHFPFIPRVRQAAKVLWVLELHPRGEDLPASYAAEVLPQADVVGITGSTLLNHTFDELVAMCRPDAYVLVMGGSTPLSPMFFDYGVNAVAGTRVVDVEAVLRAVSQGATFRQIPGKRLLTLLK